MRLIEDALKRAPDSAEAWSALGKALAEWGAIGGRPRRAAEIYSNLKRLGDERRASEFLSLVPEPLRSEIGKVSGSREMAGRRPCWSPGEGTDAPGVPARLGDISEWQGLAERFGSDANLWRHFRERVEEAAGALRSSSQAAVGLAAVELGGLGTGAAVELPANRLVEAADGKSAAQIEQLLTRWWRTADRHVPAVRDLLAEALDDAARVSDDPALATVAARDPLRRRSKEAEEERIAERTPFNPQITRWLYTHLPAEPPLDEVTTHGSGPLEADDLDELIAEAGVTPFALSEHTDFLVIGREGWEEQEIDDLLEQRAGEPLRVHSQEMFLAYLLTGVDPLEAKAGRVDGACDRGLGDRPRLVEGGVLQATLQVPLAPDVTRCTPVGRLSAS